MDYIPWPLFFFILKQWTRRFGNNLANFASSGAFQERQVLPLLERGGGAPPVPILEWTRNSPRPLLRTSQLKAHAPLSGGSRTKNRIFNRFSLLHLEQHPGRRRAAFPSKFPRYPSFMSRTLKRNMNGLSAPVRYTTEGKWARSGAIRRARFRNDEPLSRNSMMLGQPIRHSNNVSPAIFFRFNRNVTGRRGIPCIHLLIILKISCILKVFDTYIAIILFFSFVTSRNIYRRDAFNSLCRFTFRKIEPWSKETDAA